MEISSAGIKRTIGIKKKRLRNKNKKETLQFQKVLRYLLPSVVEISGAETKRRVIINKKRFQNKNQTKC